MKGHLEVIYGSMYSGKSEELIRRIRRKEIAKQSTIIFKPEIDIRYDKSDVVSHSGLKAKALPVHSGKQILQWYEDFGPYDVVAIDEAQFFDYDIFSVIDHLVAKGVIVIVAGLNQNFRGEGFGVMPELIAMADYNVHLVAVCVQCGGRATKTQRLLNGKPAPFSGETVIVGANEQYEARCRQCWEVG